MPRALWAGLELPMKASRAAEGREEAEAGPLAHTPDDADTAERERRFGARRRWRGEARVCCSVDADGCGAPRVVEAESTPEQRVRASETQPDTRQYERTALDPTDGKTDARARASARFRGPAQRARDAQATAARRSESSGGGDGEKCALQRTAGCRSGSTNDGGDGGAAWEGGPRGWW